MEKSIEQIIYDETKKRLETMESPEYPFPPKISKADVISIIVSIALCGVLILACMIGVIK